MFIGVAQSLPTPASIRPEPAALIRIARIIPQLHVGDALGASITVDGLSSIGMR